jgi:polysaccharide biosynthesis protein PslH
MRIVIIFPLCPLPLNSGGQIRVWNIAKQLSRFHELDLVCFIRKDDEKKYEAQLKTVFKNVYFIPRTPLLNVSTLLQSGASFIQFFVSNFRLLLSAISSDRPLLALLYESEQLREFISKSEREGRYDLVYAETFYGISSLKRMLGQMKTKILLIEQNVESLSYARQVGQQKNPILNKLMSYDVGKISREEQFFWEHVDLLGALSEQDRSVIEKRSGKHALLLENGVDTDFFAQKFGERKPNEVLFVGTLKYFQNVDSLKWLLDEIWPRIHESNSSLSLRIIGRGADAELKKYVEDKGFSIDESVDDIREAFQRATVLIAPLRAGGGTKYKVLESMASRLPVVTTSIGAEGLQVTDGEHLFISNTIDGFATAVINVISSKRLSTEMAEKAYSYVTSAYDWKMLVERFNSELDEIVKKK